MFTLYFLRRCYGRRIYLLIILLLLDILSAFYSDGVQHTFTRHMFMSYDLVSGFANILFWVIMFIPIAIDIIQEIGTFGVSLFCRTSKSKYMIKKSVAIFLYCAVFFCLSMLISFVVSLINGYEAGDLGKILKTYMLLVFLSHSIMILMCFVAWISNSSYIMTTVYAGMVTVTQTPGFQEKISLNYFVENLLQSVLVIVAFTVVILLAALFVMKHRDFIGMKKGMSI